jgi:acyl carrier protein
MEVQMADKIAWEDFASRIADFTGVSVEKLTRETNIFNDLGMDSLGLFSLGMYLIKTYQRKIPLSAVATMETVGDILDNLNMVTKEEVSDKAEM